MELIITQSVFVWIFGVVGVLIGLLLLMAVIAMVYVVVLLKLINEKSKDVAETIDVVQHSVREAAESFDDARSHVAQFVGAAMNASVIGNIVRSVRNAWHGKEAPEQSQGYKDVFDDIDVKSSKHPSKSKES